MEPCLGSKLIFKIGISASSYIYISSDLLGLFLLYNLTAYEEIDSNTIGIYRDDGQMIVNKYTRGKVDKIRKVNT